MSEWQFKRDTSFRKQFFVPESFSHPAKMDAQLLIKIVETYTEAGETILDPMAGSGTTMLACMLGRDVVLVEIEEKFCKMCRDNWEEVKMRPQLGYQMGTCQIIQGDARQLEGLVDKIVTSPPYAENPGTPSLGSVNKDDWGKEGKDIVARRGLERGYSKDTAGQIGNLPYGEIDKCIFSPPYAETEATQRLPNTLMSKGGQTKYEPQSLENNISNLPYGQIDKIVTSPPYEGSDISQAHMTSDKRGDPSHPEYRPSWKRKLAEGYAQTKRPYHEVDSIITSPPYDESIGHSGKDDREIYKSKGLALHGGSDYGGRDGSNIGDLKGDTYLEAMLQVYQQCHKVLKPQGLMILVTKNFIRNKQVVRLDLDTIGLCQRAGFSFLERHYRKLPSQSFWRIIYSQKHPEVEQILYEDVLVFMKANV